MQTGKVYLVGAGPGDPELITVRGVECLAEADVVLYDALAHPELLDYCRPDAERRFVGKRAGRAAARQTAINEQLLEAARAGHVVVRLKGGDPYLFGRGSEEAECLAAAGVPFEVVPGVPSPLAATAYSGISLSHRDKASSIAYLTATESPEKACSAHDFSKLATATQTLVIFMGLRKLRELMGVLMQHGRPGNCPAAVIQSASLPAQRIVVGTVADIADRAEESGLGMPALTVVGDVVELRRYLRWYDNQPLFGKRVLVTRPRRQALGFVRALRRVGAAAVEFPAIRIAPMEDEQPLEQAVKRAGSYTWTAFTSVNGVERFFAVVKRLGLDARCLGGVQLAAIGTGTALALEQHGLKADLVPAEFRGEALAEALLQHHGGRLDGVSVLLPRAEIARNAVPDRLRECGARVDVVPAYRTLSPTDEDARGLCAALSDGTVDIVTFTSPSTVRHTQQALGAQAIDLLRKVVVASIGPVTSAEAQRLGIAVDVTADTYTIAGLVDALAHHFEEQHP